MISYRYTTEITNANLRLSQPSRRPYNWSKIQNRNIVLRSSEDSLPGVAVSATPFAVIVQSQIYWNDFHADSVFKTSSQFLSLGH
ncbi:hypothetical protein TNCV_121121 [Trichonephila clavipes]|nr:hypothetical protein TNCV_121121 [Trichonephila clavipes]